MVIKKNFTITFDVQTSGNHGMSDESIIEHFNSRLHEVAEVISNNIENPIIYVSDDTSNTFDSNATWEILFHLDSVNPIE